MSSTRPGCRRSSSAYLKLHWYLSGFLTITERAIVREREPPTHQQPRKMRTAHGPVVLFIFAAATAATLMMHLMS